MHVLHQQRLVERELAIFQSIIANQRAPLDDATVACVLDAIHERLFDPSLSVGGILDECGVRSHSFQSRFKYCVHHTIRGYIEIMRLLAAMRLLTFVEIDVGLLGLNTGYSDRRVFGRAFRRVVGCTPTEYRRRMPTSGSVRARAA